MAFDWNDLRVLVAVLEHGSTRRAAAALGIDQTTCARRLAALETGLGAKLFVRDTAGYQPTPAALALRDEATRAVLAVEAFAERAEAERRRGALSIRVTCEEFFVVAVIAPAIRRFAETHPDVRIEVDVSREQRDLSAGEADLAVRAGFEPEEPSLVRRRLGDDPWAMYCSETYAERNAPPTTLADLPGQPFVCFAPVLERMRAAGLGPFIRQVATSLGAAQAAIQSGVYVGALPCVAGDAAAGLRRCMPIPDVGSAHWLIYPERVRDVRPLRDLARLIAETYAESRSPQR